MTTRPDPKDLKVWRCTDTPLCDELWAQVDEPEKCPVCDEPVQDEGYTLQEALDAENKFLVDVEVYVPVPIPHSLVQLSRLPSNTWVGLPVYHPISQMGGVGNWHRYDVGIVSEVILDPAFPDEHSDGDYWENHGRCRFITGTGGGGNVTFHYAPDNLWVPRPLAERLGIIPEPKGKLGPWEPLPRIAGNVGWGRKNLETGDIPVTTKLKLHQAEDEEDRDVWHGPLLIGSYEHLDEAKATADRFLKERGWELT
jgi:hypothetical protein